MAAGVSLLSPHFWQKDRNKREWYLLWLILCHMATIKPEKRQKAIWCCFAFACCQYPNAFWYKEKRRWILAWQLSTSVSLSLDSPYHYTVFFPVKNHIHNLHNAISSYYTKIKLQWFSVLPHGQNTLPYIMTYKTEDNWPATNIPKYDCGRDREKIQYLYIPWVDPVYTDTLLLERVGLGHWTA